MANGEINIKVVDDFQQARAEVEKWTKALETARTGSSATEESIKRMTVELLAANRVLQSRREILMEAVRSEEAQRNSQEATRQSLGAMRAELETLQRTSKEGLYPEQVEEVNLAIENLKNRIGEAEEKARGLSAGEFFGAMAGELTIVSEAAAQVSKGLQAVGVNTETFDSVRATITELITTMGVLGKVTDYVTNQEYKHAAAKMKTIVLNAQAAVQARLSAVAAHQQAAAETLTVGAKMKHAVVTGVLTAAQKVLNVAMMASPIMWLVGAVALLITGFVALSSLFGETAKAEKAAGEADKAYGEQVKKTQSTLDEVEQKRKEASAEALLQGRKELQELKQNGASKEEIARKEYEIATKNRDIQLQASEAVIKAKEEESSSLENNIQKQESLLATLSEGSKKYAEQKAKVDELKQAQRELSGEINAEYAKSQSMQQDQAEAADALKEKEMDLALDKHSKLVASQKKYNEARMKAEDDYQSDDFLKKQEYIRRLFEVNQQAERDNLELQRKYGKITQEEYNGQLALLNAAQQEFNNSRIKEMSKYYEEQRQGILSMIKKNADEQIQEVEKKYDDVLKKLGEMEAPVRLEGQSDESYAAEEEAYKAFMLKKADYEKRLKEQKNEEIAAIQKRSEEENAAAEKARLETEQSEKLERIEKELTEKYGKDLAAHAANEKEKTKIELEELAERIKMKEEAGLDVSGDKEEESGLKNKLLDMELLEAGENARAKYEIRKKHLEEELALAEGNSERQKEISQELADNEQEYLETRIAAFQEYAGQISGAMSAVSELFSAMEAAEMERYEEENEKKKADLQERLDAGLISQEEYDAGVEAADAELEKKKAEMARKQAIRDKAMKIFEIGISTASGIARALPNIPLAVLTGVMGAVQLATVLATPLPKASRGMLLQGPSHARGGIPIEAEGGEAIINKRSTSMFAPLLSAINEAGGGVPFAAPLSDGGYALRTGSSRGFTADEMGRALREAVRDVRVYTTVEDYRRADRKYTEVVNSGSY